MEKTTRKTTVLRVDGIPEGPGPLIKAELQRNILAEFPREDGFARVEINLAPSCYDGGRKLTALVEYTPAPRSLLDRDPLKDWQTQCGGAHVNVDRHFHGFTQLYQPVPGERGILADVVAITGLSGHAYGSWRGRGDFNSMWLRDFLKDDEVLRHCRTLTFGYNSKISARGTSCIQDYTDEFLEELGHVRRTEEEKSRPIIFVAHSMGGIILTNSLIHARNDPDMDAIYKATYAILFFGTPHKGFSVDDIRRVIEMQPNHPRGTLLSEIQEKSPRLTEISTNFKRVVGDRKIVSFFEVQQSRTLDQDAENQTWSKSGDYYTQVPKDSAILGIRGEKSIPVHADHGELVKFNSTSDQTYRGVIRRLQDFAKDAMETVSRRFNGLLALPASSPIISRSVTPEFQIAPPQQQPSSGGSFSSASTQSQNTESFAVLEQSDSSVADEDLKFQSAMCGVLDLMFNILEFYDAIPRALRRHRKYIPAVLGDLKAHKATFRIECLILLSYLLGAEMARTIINHRKYSRSELAALGRGFSARDFLSIAKLQQRLTSMDRKCASLFAAAFDRKSSRGQSVVKRGRGSENKHRSLTSSTDPIIDRRRTLKQNLYHKKYQLQENVRSISRDMNDFSSLCSDVTPYEELENNDGLLDRKAIDEFDITQKASETLYQSLCHSCPIHLEHVVHFSLETKQSFIQKTAKITFSLAFKQDGTTKHPIWIVAESAVSAQQVEGESERSGGGIQDPPAPSLGARFSRSFKANQNRIAKQVKPQVRKPQAKVKVLVKSLERYSLYSEPSDLSNRLGTCLGLLKQGVDEPAAFLGNHHFLFPPRTSLPKSKEPTSLAELIDRSRQNLGTILATSKRLHFATVVATAVLKFSSTSWLKSPWSSNEVVFFELEGLEGNDVLSEPHINVRLVQSKGQQQQIENSERSLCGKHPLLFSLGVILLELGYEESFQTLHKRECVDGACSEVETARRLYKGVGRKINGRYAQVVKTCIERSLGCEDNNMSDPGVRREFYEKVVCKLSDEETKFRTWLESGFPSE